MTERKIFALGFFDGVHLGHQELLTQCCRVAEELEAQPCAITFDSHPQSLFLEMPPKLINTKQDRVSLLERYGMELVRAYPVIKEVMSLPWQEFLGELVSSGAVGFVCGTDFRFGNRGEGTARKLKDYCESQNLACSIVGDRLLQGVRVSSTHIRDLLEVGEMEAAVRFLGHPHILSGEVVGGRRIGRTIGVPTANLVLPEEVIVPRFGVYACKACFGGREHLAVTNIGNRPTVEGSHVTVEPWILDYTGDLYGKTIRLEFHSFLRPERKFASLEELRREIQKNAEQTREFFGKN